MAVAHRRLRPALGLVVALFLLGAVGATSPGVPTVEATGPAWHGGIDLYRTGVFTTQKSWLWCTAAGIQIVSNIVDHRTDHTTSGQRRYFDWMRRHNRYVLPLSAGVDAQGWAAGFRQFIDPRYRLVASKTFDSALRLAVTRLRQTNLPVGLTVSRGNHAWILTGFTATADPLKTTTFTVTSVRVTGPLYGLQSKNGYDMRPDTKLSVARLRTFFTPWRYKPKRMIWDGLYVSIQPVPAATTAKTPATRTPAAKPTPAAVAGIAATPSPASTQVDAPTIAVPTPSAAAAPAPGPSDTPSPAAAVGVAAGPGPPGGAASAATPFDLVLVGAVGLVILAVVAAGSIAASGRARQPR